MSESMIEAIRPAPARSCVGQAALLDLSVNAESIVLAASGHVVDVDPPDAIADAVINGES